MSTEDARRSGEGSGGVCVSQLLEMTFGGVTGACIMHCMALPKSHRGLNSDTRYLAHELYVP